MTYQRIPSEAELDAAAILREHGWTVQEPRCPDCKGWGLLGVEVDDVWTVQACPQGCEAVAILHNNSGAA